MVLPLPEVSMSRTMPWTITGLRFFPSEKLAILPEDRAAAGGGGGFLRGDQQFPFAGSACAACALSSAIALAGDAP